MDILVDHIFDKTVGISNIGISYETEPGDQNWDINASNGISSRLYPHVNIIS